MSTGRFTEPLRLTPVLVPKPWGGRRLSELGYQLPLGQRIGEAWLVADLDPLTVTSANDPVTRVADGPFAGRSLQELIALDRGSLLGSAEPIDGRFPLLVKLLDAREHLSVQLHPHAAFAAEDPTVAVKTETWVVLDAEPGAELMLGLADGVTADDLVAALGTPEVAELLRRVPARPGETHHVPAGTVHALGAGVIVAEVQTPSDTTFRLYDWTAEYDRPPREIHRDQAARCLELQDPGGAGEFVLGATGVRTPAYSLDRRALPPRSSARADAGVVRVVLVLSGEVDIATSLYRQGEAAVLPARWEGEIQVADEPAVVLEIVPTATA